MYERTFHCCAAQNAGFRWLRETAPDLGYLQFIDGDCELNQQWPGQAIGFLDTRPEVVAVCGRRRERFPENRFIIGYAMRSGIRRRVRSELLAVTL